MNIPRENSKQVQAILEREDLNNQDKAVMIHNYDYNMLCLENDGYLPKQMTEREIKDILDKR